MADVLYRQFASLLLQGIQEYMKMARNLPDSCLTVFLGKQVKACQGS